MPAHNACRPRHTPCSAPYPSPWRGADIRAVGTHGDAAPQVLDHLLTEAGVGAGATRLGAIEACLYALDECIGVHGCGAWMGVEHLPCVNHQGTLPPLAFLSASLTNTACAEGSEYDPEALRAAIDFRGTLFP